MAHIRYRRIVEPRRAVDRCQHPGCTEQGIEVVIRFGDDEHPSYFCPDHAYENGYCALCGDFNAGHESFDFNNPMGVCENCRDAIEGDLDHDGDESDCDRDTWETYQDEAYAEAEAAADAEDFPF
jgi:hypothetical protein